MEEDYINEPQGSFGSLKESERLRQLGRRLEDLLFYFMDAVTRQDTIMINIQCANGETFNMNKNLPAFGRILILANKVYSNIRHLWVMPLRWLIYQLPYSLRSNNTSACYNAIHQLCDILGCCKSELGIRANNVKSYFCGPILLHVFGRALIINGEDGLSQLLPTGWEQLNLCPSQNPLPDKIGDIKSVRFNVNFTGIVLVVEKHSVMERIGRILPGVVTICTGGVVSRDTNACCDYLYSIAKEQDIDIQFKGMCDMDPSGYINMLNVKHVQILGLLPSDINTFNCAIEDFTEDDIGKANGLVGRIVETEHNYLVKEIESFVLMKKKASLDRIGGGKPGELLKYFCTKLGITTPSIDKAPCLMPCPDAPEDSCPDAPQDLPMEDVNIVSV